MAHHSFCFKRTALLLVLLCAASALFACTPAPEAAPAPAAEDPAPTASAAPLPAPTPTVDPVQLAAARQAQYEADREAYVAQCTYHQVMNLLQEPGQYMGQQMVFAGLVHESYPEQNAALVYDQCAPSMRIEATFTEAGIAAQLGAGMYVILYGRFGGMHDGLPQEDTHAQAVSLEVAYVRAFTEDSLVAGSALTEEYLQGSWANDPEGRTPYGYAYRFENDTLVMNDYLFGKLSSIFEGSYTFPKPNRLHHRYSITSFAEDGSELGTWTGRLNHDITPVTRDVFRVENRIYFRAGAEPYPFVTGGGEAWASPAAVTPAEESPAADTPAPTAVASATPVPTPGYRQSDRLQEAIAMNPDVIGWITVPNTAIDFPVLYGENWIYHTHDIHRQPSKIGCVYTYYDVLTRNIPIQGNRGLQSKELLYGLNELYAKRELLQERENRLFRIELFTITEWEVFAMYETPEDEPKDTFRYNTRHLADATDAEVLEWAKKQKARSVLKNMIDVPVSGDDIYITLITGPGQPSFNTEARLYVFLKAPQPPPAVAGQ